MDICLERAPVAGSSIWSNGRTWANKATADIFQDYSRQPVIDEPSPRRATIRCFVALLIVIVVIITTSLVYELSGSPRTVRHWGASYLLSLPTGPQNYPNLFCPCTKAAIPWPYYIAFYWINQTENQAGSWTRYPITNFTHFCDPLVADNQTSTIWRESCNLMGQSIIGFTNETMRTTVSTNSITSPSVLGHIIAVDMEDNVNNVFSDYAYLAVNSTADWVQLSKVKQMFTEAAERLIVSTKSMGDQNATNAAYWRSFAGAFYKNPMTGGTTRAFDLTGNRALVIEMNWSVYVGQCNPFYCDKVVKDTLGRRFATAVTAVGGSLTVLIVLLRVIVWPAIRSLNKWPS